MNNEPWRDLRIGDRVRILRFPSEWNSRDIICTPTLAACISNSLNAVALSGWPAKFPRIRRSTGARLAAVEVLVDGQCRNQARISTASSSASRGPAGLHLQISPMEACENRLCWQLPEQREWMGIGYAMSRGKPEITIWLRPAVPFPPKLR